MVDINPNVSIITLNINGLNTPIKRQRLLKVRADQKKKKEARLYVVYRKLTLNIKTLIDEK